MGLFNRGKKPSEQADALSQNGTSLVQHDSHHPGAAGELVSLSDMFLPETQIEEALRITREQQVLMENTWKEIREELHANRVDVLDFKKISKVDELGIQDRDGNCLS